MAATSSFPAYDAEEPVYSFSANDAKEAIRKTGAYVMEDARAGYRVDEFIYRKKLPLKKADGLTFCAQHSLYDKTARDVIESSLDRPHWGVAKQYKSDILPTDQAYFFVHGPKMRTIYILLFTPETRLLLFEGSHDAGIAKEEFSLSEFGLFTLSPDALKKREGIRLVQHDMTKGGFAFIDGRVGWTILGGEQIAIGYASESEITHWGRTQLGDTASLRDKVTELNNRGIKTKFEFIKPESTAPNA